MEDATQESNEGTSVTNNSSNTNKFAGVVINNKEKERNQIVIVEEKIPLRVDQLEITTTGLFTVNFNKPILKPPLKISTEARRILQETAPSKLYDV